MKNFKILKEMLKEGEKDRSVLNIAADWLEDNQEETKAEGLRWLIDNNKSPYKFSESNFQWRYIIIMTDSWFLPEEFFGMHNAVKADHLFNSCFADAMFLAIVIYETVKQIKDFCNE